MEERYYMIMRGGTAKIFYANCDASNLAERARQHANGRSVVRVTRLSDGQDVTAELPLCACGQLAINGILCEGCYA